ncbi:MAG: 2-oxo acid dehydrogenase subunit E2 [Acidimicrobiia bacterium]|nr:2-oxo acid dehydrogenase subunit E2 [Acidimicrobiia bacterium]
MAQQFRLPDIGEGLVEAEIVAWHVTVGDVVAVDQVIVEVETDKSLVDIPSPYAGTVLALGGNPGDVVEVGDVLIVIGAAGETVDATDSPAPVESVDLQQEAVSRADEVSGGSSARAMPAVRKAARERGIDLTTIHGTGPGGSITLGDLDQSTASSSSAATVAGDERVPMSRTRRAIAEHMQRSWSEIPHVTTLHEARADQLLAARTALASDSGVAVPIEALVIRAVLPVLDAHPRFNASIDGDDLVLHARRDIGVAVDTAEGLIVPVVRSADTHSAVELARLIAELAERAKNRRVAPDDLSGATFTITNIGAIGGGHGTPIIPLGTLAILSIGKAEPKPVVEKGEIVVGTVMPLSISYDHRAIDGAMGQRFMAAVIANLEDPSRFL